MTGHEKQPTQGTNASAPALLSTEQAANYLSISTRTLANWRCVGRPHLKHTRVGTRIRYYKAALDAYLDKNTVPGSEGQ